MTGGGGDSPSANGGEFLLQLLKNSSRQSPQPPQLLPHDPAVAAIGPAIPLPFPHSLQPDGFPSPWSQNHYHQSPPPPPHPPFAPHDFFLQNLNNSGGFLNDGRKVGLPQANSRASVANLQEQKGLVFGSFRGNDESMSGNSSENRSVSRQPHVSTQKSWRLNGVEVGFEPNSVDFDRDKRGNMSDSRVYVHEGRNYSGGDRKWDKRGGKEVYHRGTLGLPGVAVKQNSGYTNRWTFEQNGERESSNFGKSKYPSDNGEREGQSFHKIQANKNARWEERKLSNNSSVSASSAPALRDQNGENSEMLGNGIRESTERRDDHKGQSGLDDLEERLADSLHLVEEVDEKSGKTKHHRSRDKEYRSDKRGQSIMGQRMRYMKRQLVCRGDIERWNTPFLAIYESLIPAEDEKAKQKQLLTLLENVATKHWPGARLYLYGSCANSFGFPKSDLDVCLTIEDADIDKAEVLLKLADLLQSENLLNVQALTRARVPIVKLMDPTTGISCDICVNNVLAVVNTKLLRDYAEIDVRLRQLAFMVKHWAKSRGVNETYQGTLSSYAYVLMCIHFLQLRRPAVLPCLQEMNPTYSVTVDNVECAYFDHVEKLSSFGSRNGESISRLLWAFFHYWAYCHDYANDVISVRRGCILSKRFKDWTRRIGNDRHLICIEDPFEVSHDLGRVVDRCSIKVLREEFERAAEIMQYDPNPCVTLFEPYIPA